MTCIVYNNVLIVNLRVNCEQKLFYGFKKQWIEFRHSLNILFGSKLIWIS